MRKVFNLFFSIFLLMIIGCGRDKDQLKPGERFKIDTMMYKEYRRMDPDLDAECKRRFDPIYRRAFDSIHELRIKDIESIKIQKK